ncbi:MAG: flippase-like domain-containing protein [Chitinivibrionales bacterium]|nr:flippase-like domain-containing protein [Chitinivibrionales bacterium]
MKTQSNTRSFAIFLLKLGITTAVLVFVIWKLGWESILSTIAQAEPWWMVAALGVFFVSGVLGSVQWQVLLRNRGISMPFHKAFMLYFVGMFFNNFIFGMVAGDAVRVTYLRIGHEDVKAGFAATFLDRFAGFWAMSAFAVVAGLLLVWQRSTAGRGLWYIVAVLSLMFLLFAGVMAFLVSRPLQTLVFRLVDGIRVADKHKLKLRAILQEMIIEAHDSHIVAPVAALAVVVQFLRVSVHVLCAASLGIVAGGSLYYFFVFVPVLAMTMIAPLPFGIRESIEGSLFAIAGFKPEAAVVMGFLASLVGIAVSLLGAVFFLAGKRHSREVPS